MQTRWDEAYRSRQEDEVRYALLTGAGGGLGGAAAKALAGSGWTVLAADINTAALDKLAKTSGIIPLTMDVTSGESVDQAVAWVQDQVPQLDVVANFAGIHALGSFVEGDVATTLAKMTDINLMGMVRVNRACFPLLVEHGGRIINCSSECGYMKAQPFNGLYTVTKYGVEAYSDSLRREVAPLGVKVIKIQPGSFDTALLDAAQTSFDRLYATTAYHKSTLTKMKPLMTAQFDQAHNPSDLAKAVLKAATSKHPASTYRVKNSKLMGAMELIPDRLLDAIYKIVLK